MVKHLDYAKDELMATELVVPTYFLMATHWKQSMGGQSVFGLVHSMDWLTMMTSAKTVGELMAQRTV